MILHLVRHPPVTKHWQGRCYGQSDPGLSREGRAMVVPLVDQLAALTPDMILHSDMKRTRAIAEPLARRLGLDCAAEPLWRERDFGSWEGQSWPSIYRATGNAMDGMLDDPEHFCPGGGETTYAQIRRVHIALSQLPKLSSIVVISHGGAIACARLVLGNMGVEYLAAMIPRTGQIISLPLNQTGIAT